MNLNDFLFNIGLLNPLEGWTVTLTSTIAVIGLIVWCSWRTNSLWLIHSNYSAKTVKIFLANCLVIYPFHAFIQQLLTFMCWVIFNYFFPGWPWATALTAFIFACFHHPNFFLMWGAGFLMYFSLQHMEMYHNIFALSLMHGMVASCWERLTPKWIVTSADTWVTHPGKYARYQRLLNKKYNLLKRNYDKLI